MKNREKNPKINPFKILALRVTKAAPAATALESFQELLFSSTQVSQLEEDGPPTEDVLEIQSDLTLAPLSVNLTNLHPPNIYFRAPSSTLEPCLQLQSSTS